MMAAILGEVEGSRRLLAKDPACLNTGTGMRTGDGLTALMLGKSRILYFNLKAEEGASSLILGKLFILQLEGRGQSLNAHASIVYF
jgi:hypothetical protein